MRLSWWGGQITPLLLEQRGILSLRSGTAAGELCLLAQSKRCCELAYHLITQRAISIDGKTWLSFLISAIVMTPRSSKPILLYSSGLVLWYNSKNQEDVQRLLAKSCSSRKLLLENSNGPQRACLSVCRLKQCGLVGNGTYHLSDGSTVVSRQVLETEGLFPEWQQTNTGNWTVSSNLGWN